MYTRVALGRGEGGEAVGGGGGGASEEGEGTHGWDDGGGGGRPTSQPASLPSQRDSTYHGFGGEEFLRIDGCLFAERGGRVPGL